MKPLRVTVLVSDLRELIALAKEVEAPVYRPIKQRERLALFRSIEALSSATVKQA